MKNAIKARLGKWLTWFIYCAAEPSQELYTVIPTDGVTVTTAEHPKYVHLPPGE